MPYNRHTLQLYRRMFGASSRRALPALLVDILFSVELMFVYGCHLQETYVLDQFMRMDVLFYACRLREKSTKNIPITLPSLLSYLVAASK